MKFSKFKKDLERLHRVADEAGIDIGKYDSGQLMMGMDVEREHSGLKGRDIIVAKSDGDLLKIAIAHLREDPKYYTKLEKAGL